MLINNPFLAWPAWLATALSLTLGLVIGSFLNVVIARMPAKQSIVRPRSRCPSCSAEIKWYDNIPVASYLALRGKCRGCRVRIPVRYPMVELLTALLFLAARNKFDLSWALLFRDFPFLALCVAITFIDLDHRIIPDKLSLTGLALGLATSWMVDSPGLTASFIGAALGFTLFYALAWGYQTLAGRSGLGGGDIKLLAMIGAFVGPSGVLATILISSVLGSLFGIGWALLTKKTQLMSVSIPYGPFLILGALYYYLLGDILWPQFMIPI